MIVDSFENWNRYELGPEWGIILDFIQSLSLDSDDEKYMFEGNDICAIKMTYNTKTREEAVLESHRDYVDIQMLLAGEERLEWSRPDKLTVKTPYEKGNDVTFFEHPEKPDGAVTLRPGIFTVLFPEEDVHSPQIMAGSSSEEVVKIVVKIHRDILTY